MTQKLSFDPNDIKHALARAVSNIPDDNPYNEAVDLIIEQCHNKHGAMYITGVGKAGLIATAFAAMIASNNTAAHFMDPVNSGHGDMGRLRENDMLFVVSNSGRTDEVLNTITFAKNKIPNIKIIALTSNPESPIAKQADIVLLTGAPTEVCHLGKTPTSSIIAMEAVYTIVAMGVSRTINLDMNTYQKGHHAGYLGQQATAELKHNG